RKLRRNLGEGLDQILVAGFQKQTQCSLYSFVERELCRESKPLQEPNKYLYGLGQRKVRPQEEGAGFWIKQGKEHKRAKKHGLYLCVAIKRICGFLEDFSKCNFTK
ncbi:hypothetical protein V8G54_013345, partial [Vigna mungo]